MYKQAKYLFGLRHKPITLQDDLPKSESSRENLPRPDPLSPAETSPFWLRNWRICIGVSSSDWAGGGGDGVLGAEPNGESGVVFLLARVVAGVEVGLGIGNTCGVAAGDGWAFVGAAGPAFSGAAGSYDVDDKGYASNRDNGSWLGKNLGGESDLSRATRANDVLKLNLFPYSLRDKAKTWLNNLQPGSLQSWTQLCRCFIAKFSYTNMTDHLRNQITSFRQEDDKAMHEAWERYRDLFRRCPMHGLPEWTQVSIFYNSVNTPTRMMLDASANGTLLDKPPRESLEILDKLAQNDYQHPTAIRGSNMQKQPHIQEVKALDAFCDQCGSNHNASECGQQVESSCYVGNYNRNNISNTYNTAWRNHRNFSWKNQRFSSDTEVAKGATHEQCNVITTRSGKILKNNQEGTAVNPPPAKDTPAKADTPAQASEDHRTPPPTMGENSAESSNAQSYEPVEIRPLPPFPQRLKKQKHVYQFKNFLDILKQVNINLPLVEALQQMPNYAKFLKDMVTRKKRIEEFETAAATETCLALMHNKPEGKIEDILVKVDKFIFPADFLILDCEANIDAPIILGRPFLATGRILFDFGDEELIFRADQEERLIATLRQQKEALGWTIADIKGMSPTICMYKILLDDDHKPTVDAQHRLNQAMKDVVRKEILKWIDAGIIYPISDSEWVSPVQCVPKKGGITVISNEKNELIPTMTVTGWRVCMDYRKLNKATRKDHFPLPFIDQMLDRLAGKEFYCFLNGYSGYNQIAIAPEDQSKTTFTCPYGTFAFRRMPFGLCNAPATFQRCMTTIFSDLNEDCLESFMDDFSTFWDNFDNCLSNLEKVLKRCKETNLVLNWEKCHFMVDEGIVLGHKISSKGMEVDKAKIEVLSKLPPPTTVKGICSFLGHAGFYRRFIEDFSKITKPLCSLLEQGRPFEFNNDCTKAFNLLKQKLVNAPIVEPPDWKLPFELMCDASDYAVGAVLGQRKGKIFHPIYYASKTLNDAQVNYTTIEKEMLTVIFTFDKFRSYLIGTKGTLRQRIARGDSSTVEGTVYKQAEQLFGLRHKPITLQDALPRSEPCRDNLPRPDLLSLAETSEYRSLYIEEVEALKISPEATID
ncbi:hypothetical protein GQ457_04G021310 [Hibiscus cannabinus]